MYTPKILFALFLTLSFFQFSMANELLKIGGKTASGAIIMSSYQEGIAITKKYDKFGLVNEQGLEIITPRFDQIHAFQNGYAAVKQHGKWSFINKQGKKIAPCRYDWVGNFKNGFAPVQLNKKWGFINEQGIKICSIEFDAVQNFDSKQALVRKGKNWYILTSKGELKTVKGTIYSRIDEKA